MPLMSSASGDRFFVSPKSAKLNIVTSTIFGKQRTGFYRLISFFLPAATGEFVTGLETLVDRAQQLSGLASVFLLLASLQTFFTVEGAVNTLWDSSKNRKAYPPLTDPNKPSFPMMRIVVLFSLLSGAILAVSQGSLQTSELALFTLLTKHLHPQDIVVADRGFGYYAAIAWLKVRAIWKFFGEFPAIFTRPTSGSNAPFNANP